jgi:hypothetical protein
MNQIAANHVAGDVRVRWKMVTAGTDVLRPQLKRRSAIRVFVRQ